MDVDPVVGEHPAIPGDERHGEEVTVAEGDRRGRDRGSGSGLERADHLPQRCRADDVVRLVGLEAPAGGVLAHDPTTVERASTCIALIEIVTSCNLECPTCFAGSERKETVECLSFGEIVARVESVLSRKKNIDILQLSGGEPTIHPEFFRVLEWALSHPRIGYCLLALAVALFVIAFAIGFSATMATLVVVCLVASFVLLAAESAALAAVASSTRSVGAGDR